MMKIPECGNEKKIIDWMILTYLWVILCLDVRKMRSLHIYIYNFF